jgi:hypothetical protein
VGCSARTPKSALKSYDLVWLLHLVGDVHQPLHCATRVSATAPQGDDGGNKALVVCDGCQTAQRLHALWDDLPGTAKSVKLALTPVIAAATKLPTPDPTLAAKSDEKAWVAESFQAAQAVVYQPPILAGNGPFTLTPAYTDAARTVAQERVALAAARLANLLNKELK